MEQTKQDLEVLWTPRQVAAYFSISLPTVYNWLSKGEVFDPEKIVHISNKVRIPRSEVERIARKKKAKIIKATPIK